MCAAAGFGGEGLDRLAVVLTLHGIGTLDNEYARSHDGVIDGLRLRVLPLERVVASKRATNRLKDRAVLPVLKATLLAGGRSNE